MTIVLNPIPFILIYFGQFSDFLPILLLTSNLLNSLVKSSNLGCQFIICSQVFIQCFAHQFRQRQRPKPFQMYSGPFGSIIKESESYAECIGLLFHLL